MKKCFFVLLVLFGQFMEGQELESLVLRIQQTGVIQLKSPTDHIPENYANFLKLKETAEVDELITLLDHKSAVVAAYAGWALVEKGYSDFVDIFKVLEKRDEEVYIHDYDFRYKDKLSYFFYSRCQRVSAPYEANLALDVFIISMKNPDLLLLSRVLEKGGYEREHNEQIAHLAFKKENIVAVLYLSKWYKADYSDQLEEALIKYLNKTDFSEYWAKHYLEIILELMSFNGDHHLDLVIEEKLENDRSWQDLSGLFRSYLDIYDVMLPLNIDD